MTPEDPEYGPIVERLVTDFQGLIAFETILTVLREQVAAHPEHPADVVEAATRMNLKIHRQGQEHNANH